MCPAPAWLPADETVATPVVALHRWGRGSRLASHQQAFDWTPAMARTRENAMQIRRFLLATAALGMVLALPAAPASAQVLGGQVSSAEEGNMEGVVVSAKKAGSTVTISVVSNDKGEFTFP